MVDGRPARAPCGIVGGGLGKALSLGLRGKGNHRGRAAHRRRAWWPSRTCRRSSGPCRTSVRYGNGDRHRRGSRSGRPRRYSRRRSGRCRWRRSDRQIRAISAVKTVSAVATRPPLMTRIVLHLGRDLGAGAGPSPDPPLDAAPAACKTMRRRSGGGDMGRAVMIQGTGSNVGKSLLVAGLVRGGAGAGHRRGPRSSRRTCRTTPP